MKSFTGRYPDNWAGISYRVKQEAGWRCIRCGHRSESSGPDNRKPCDRHCDLTRHPEYWELPTDKMRTHMLEYLSGESLAELWLLEPRQRILTVHHFDGDKSNNHWWNLMALCQVCHLVIQGKVNPEQPWLFEHSEWMRPYVAGYYATTKLGHSIPRQAAEDPQVQPALLELGVAPDPDEIVAQNRYLQRVLQRAKNQN